MVKIPIALFSCKLCDLCLWFWMRVTGFFTWDLKSGYHNPGRPIVSACSCPTDLISSYLDRIMTPIVKDKQDKLIFTMEITSLYTVIPNSEGLQALLKTLFRSTYCQRTKLGNAPPPCRTSFNA